LCRVSLVKCMYNAASQTFSLTELFFLLIFYVRILLYDCLLFSFLLLMLSSIFQNAHKHTHTHTHIHTHTHTHTYSLSLSLSLSLYYYYYYYHYYPLPNSLPPTHKGGPPRAPVRGSEEETRGEVRVLCLATELQIRSWPALLRVPRFRNIHMQARAKHTQNYWYSSLRVLAHKRARTRMTGCMSECMAVWVYF
jgi:hypothetical protein